MGAFIKQVTFNLGIIEEHNLALQKRAIPGSGNTCTENNTAQVYVMVENMNSGARIQVLDLPFNSWGH